MADDEVALRGFDMAMPGIGDQLHFRQPLLSFCNRSTLYVARRVDWRGDKRALAIVDDPDDLEMATLLADGVERHVASGEGVVVPEPRSSKPRPASAFNWTDSAISQPEIANVGFA